MDSLIETFHIDVKLLLAQIINFGIVFSVLYFFALKPLMKTMGERTKKIEKGLTDAKQIEERLSQTEKESHAELAKAKKEAGDIIEKARVMADVKRQELLTKAKEEIGEIINGEKAKMQTEKAQVLKEIKKEISDLVYISVEKVLEEKLDEKKDKEMIKKIIK